MKGWVRRVQTIGWKQMTGWVGMTCLGMNDRLHGYECSGKELYVNIVNPCNSRFTSTLIEY